MATARRKRVKVAQPFPRKEHDIVTFSLHGSDHIALHNLLKIEGWCESGAAAKQVIDTGAVRVDGEVELRRRRKVEAGSTVTLGSQTLVVVD